MNTTFSGKWEMERLGYTTRLVWNSTLMYFRSRQGFMSMLALFRLVCILALVLRFWSQIHISSLTQAWFWLPYLLFSLVVFCVVFFQSNYARIDRLTFYGVIIIVDTLAIDAFLFLSGDHKSEIYLLLLLPLILTSHYLPRLHSLIASLAIVLSYGVTLLLMVSPVTIAAILEENIEWIWLMRSLFLLCATWVYRMQANFPHINETRIVSPESARSRLEELLIGFRQAVEYDTISVQILYRDRLQIIACHGFQNPKEICQIEFPVNNPSYPNYEVLKDKHWRILDPNNFPSFKEPRYHAGHIQTWLGVPLISPSTGECFGLVSIDSSRPDSYNRWDAMRARWFAIKVSAFLTDVTLGPAALTQATKRENLLDMLKDWAELFQPKRIFRWEDDLQAVEEIVHLGTRIFHVEDCSIYFLRHKINEDGEKSRVLHLVASSAIPCEVFNLNEIHVTGHHGDGLTGMAVNRNRTINYGAEQIARSPYRSKFVAHLDYLFSKRSRQIMIVPLRDSKGKTTGAIKLENRLGWPSEKPFFQVEQHSFEIFASMVSLLLEDIRLHNFANRQSQNIHNLRAIIHTCALKPIEEMIAGAADNKDGFCQDELQTLESARNTISYTKIGLDSLLAETADNPLLESEGLPAAVHELVESLKSMTQLQPAAERISFQVEDVRDSLPLRIRIGFYNIAREAILNMARHSGIEKKIDGFCRISFQTQERVYHLRIEDNGDGFSPEQKLEQSYSFGLRDMYFQREAIRKHCQDAGIEIAAQPGSGVRIHVWADLS
jgi:hypothetical protein